MTKPRMRVLECFMGIWSLGTTLFLTGCPNGGGNDDTDPLCTDGACDSDSDDADSESESESVTATDDDCGSCDDGNLCTEDLCDAGECVHIPAESACDDGIACTKNDQCIEGVCKGTLITCDDGNECTYDHCEDGECVFSNNNSRCDDNDACTEMDQCSDGVCQGMEISCDDSNECTEDSCKDGQCIFEKVTGPCDDGDACSIDDTCQDGECVPGEPLTCEDDDNPCTDELCENGACIMKNNNNPCDDGNPCTIDDRCHDGACEAGCPIYCDDGNPCTDDICTPDGCINTPNSAPCDDGDACSAGDVCDMGVCVSGPVINCDDGNLCTDDSCEAGVCSHTANSQSCDDGNDCTENDVCDFGSCQGVLIDCDDDNPCTDDTCESGTCIHHNNTDDCDDHNACTVNDQCAQGVCLGAEVICDDFNECTEDVCVAGKCVYEDISESCDDGDACTLNDVCSNGVCGGTPKSCNDGNPCTNDRCAQGICYSTNNNETCNDGEACTINDQCSQGVCAGEVINCDDSNECTEDFCVDGVCDVAYLSGSCDDGDDCTVEDACSEGVCSGDAMVCRDDGNVCTDEVCSDGICISENNADACDDGDACTNNDICADGICRGASLNCDDGDECTEDTCNNGTCIHTDNGSCIDSDTGSGHTDAGQDTEDTETTDEDTESETETGTTDTCTTVTYEYRQGVNNYAGVTDIMLKQENPDVVYLDDSALEVDYEDKYNTPNTESQGLIKFDTIFGESEGKIPTTGVIEAASLELYTSNSTAGPVRLHRMLIDWSDSSTWNSLASGVAADDIDARAAADSEITSPTQNSTSTFDVTATLTAWHQSTSSNFGWVLLNENTDGWDVRSSDNTTVSTRPRLVIDVCVYSHGDTESDTGEDTEEDTASEADAGIDECDPAVITFRPSDAYSGMVDIEIQQANPDDTNAVGDEISVDLEANYNQTNTESQALIRFEELFGATGIPLDAPIDSAVLSVYATNETTDEIRLHRMLSPWTSNTTWNSLTDGVTTDDIESSSTPDAQLSAPGKDDFFTFDVTDSVRLWQQEPTLNYGWVMLNDGTNGWDFYTSEHGETSYRPSLTVAVCGDNVDTDPVDTDTNESNLFKPVVVYPQDGSTDIGPSPTLRAAVSSVDGSNLNVTFHGREQGGETWTLIAIPDTQYYSQSYPDIFTAQTKWIVENREALNIQMVVHEGDIVNTPNSRTQWNHARNAMDILVNADIPFTLSLGNHDHVGFNTRGSTDNFEQAFPVKELETLSWWIDDSNYFDGRNNNNSHYVTLNINKEDYIFIGLDFCPDADEIAWANGVLDTYSDHKAVLTTHALINDSGEYRGGQCLNTRYIFDDLIYHHANLQIVLCGHMHDGPRGNGEAYVEATNVANLPVHQMLANYQDKANGGNGMLRILTFNPAEDKIYVSTYSPISDSYETDNDSRFVLDYDMEGGVPFSQLGQVNVVSQSEATMVFDTPRLGTTYEWYIEVSDGVETVISPIWRFTTLGPI